MRYFQRLWRSHIPNMHHVQSFAKGSCMCTIYFDVYTPLCDNSLHISGSSLLEILRFCQWKGDKVFLSNHRSISSEQVGKLDLVSCKNLYLIKQTLSQHLLIIFLLMYQNTFTGLWYIAILNTWKTCSNFMNCSHPFHVLKGVNSLDETLKKIKLSSLLFKKWLCGYLTLFF